MSKRMLDRHMGDAPDPWTRLAAAVFAMSADDLCRPRHQAAASRWFDSGDCAVFAALLGVDHFEIKKRVRHFLDARSNDWSA